MNTMSRRSVVIMMLATLFVVTIFQPALVGAIACATAVGLREAHPSGPTDPRKFEAFLDTYLAEQMKAHHIPGVVSHIGEQTSCESPQRGSWGCGG